MIDSERQIKAKQYARLQRRLSILAMGISGLYAGLWLALGWANTLQGSLNHLSTSRYVQVPLFAIIFGGIYMVISLPLDFYAGFILPHRFGLSVETIQGWIIDQIKGLGISAPLGLFLLEIIYAILYYSPVYWWLWAALVLMLFSVVLANLAPILLMPLFYKFTPLAAEHADLAERLTRLAEQAGAKVNGVFQFDLSRRTVTANAALTGIGNTRRIIVGDTLINEFTPDEIETVLAHELGHHAHHDIPIGILIESLVLLLGLYLVSVAAVWGVKISGLSALSNPASLPLIGLLIGLYEILTMPLLNFYSRWRESNADRYAITTTQKGEAFASAMIRLANQNLADVDPEPWVEFFFYSHPALSKRIKMAQTNHKSMPS